MDPIDGIEAYCYLSSVWLTDVSSDSKILDTNQPEITQKPGNLKTCLGWPWFMSSAHSTH
jgi:hypothetical protein